MAHPLMLTVSGLTGELCRLEASPSWSVRDVKKALEMRLEIPARQQRLLLDSVELLDDEILEGKSPCAEPADLVLIRRSLAVAEWLEQVERNPLNFKKAPDSIRTDREVTCCALKRNGCMLEYAATELRADAAMAHTAVKQDGSALEFVAEELREDFNLVSLAVSKSGRALQFAAEALRMDHHIVLLSVQTCGSSLRWAMGDTRASREIALAAVGNWGQSLEFVDECLRNDREIVLAAVARDGQAIQYASAALHEDREVVLAAFERGGGSNLRFCSATMRGDREIVSAALKQSFQALQYASEELQTEFAPPPKTWMQTAKDVGGAFMLGAAITGWAVTSALVGRRQDETPAPPAHDDATENPPGVINIAQEASEAES
eukprot:gnl/TRDRNA2_/TRDRNA2_73515_c1_seq1.p1 gnl/TRDRNA2_/TRDRNA2_73515_c1~~gnl/TRDRNA2_/TRDRNA2_73515_c1_seq1.p1  ORF type:complete len:377 (+),score=58.82 gnl/TRDRNA2_/TRDRNA2_73515_c1_seq1:30-1160(+)